MSCCLSENFVCFFIEVKLTTKVAYATTIAKTTPKPNPKMAPASSFGETNNGINATSPKAKAINVPTMLKMKPIKTF